MSSYESPEPAKYYGCLKKLEIYFGFKAQESKQKVLIRGGRYRKTMVHRHCSSLISFATGMCGYKNKKRKGSLRGLKNNPI